MLFNAALIVSRAPLAVVKRGRASLPIRLPVPLSDQILTGRVRISNVIMMRARRFHTSPNAKRNEWLPEGGGASPQRWMASTVPYRALLLWPPTLRLALRALRRGQQRKQPLALLQPWRASFRLEQLPQPQLYLAARMRLRLPRRSQSAPRGEMRCAQVTGSAQIYPAARGPKGSRWSSRRARELSRRLRQGAPRCSDWSRL